MMVNIKKWTWVFKKARNERFLGCFSGDDEFIGVGKYGFSSCSLSFGSRSLPCVLASRRNAWVSRLATIMGDRWSGCSAWSRWIDISGGYGSFRQPKEIIAAADRESRAMETSVATCSGFRARRLVTKCNFSCQAFASKAMTMFDQVVSWLWPMGAQGVRKLCT